MNDLRMIMYIWVNFSCTRFFAHADDGRFGCCKVVAKRLLQLKFLRVSNISIVLIDKASFGIL